MTLNIVNSICRRALIYAILCVNYTAFGMEVISKERLIDDIAQDLKRGTLTFSSQVPRPLLDMFNTAVDEKVRERLKDDVFVNPKSFQPQYKGQQIPRELTVDERLRHLDTLKAKANALYSERKLTSYWLTFIGLNVAGLLSEGSPYGKTGLVLDLDASTVEESFERFSYLNDLRTKDRAIVVSYLYPPTIPSNDIYGNETLTYTNEAINENHNIEIPFRNFGLGRMDCYRNLKWVLCTDCFFVPLILENPLLKISTLNKAYAHRIAPIIIPLKNSDYDGFVAGSPFAFADHEAFHANIFENNYLSFSDKLDLQFHPMQNLMYEVWEKLQATPQGMFAYLMVFHENGFQVRKFYEKTGTITFEDAIGVVRKRFKEDYNHDMSSAENFIRNCVRGRGHENPDFLGRTDFDAFDIVYRLPGDPEPPEGQYCPGRNLRNPPFSMVKNDINGYLSYFHKLGAPLDPTMKDDPQLGVAYSTYVEQSLQQALKMLQ